MPRSKRAKVVHLSKVAKKDKSAKNELFAKLRAAVSSSSHVFVFAVDNMRNSYLKDVRSYFSSKGDRLFLGKTKVMAKALGSSPEDETATGIHTLTEHISGEVGLLCSNQEPEEVIRYLEEYVQMDFARAGAHATREMVVPAGVVHSRGGEIPVEEDLAMPHSMEPNLRRWGMPTRLDKGKIILDDEYEVCREGQELNSHQTALLKMFGVMMAEFRVQPLAYWDGKKEEVVVLDKEAMEE